MSVIADNASIEVVVADFALAEPSGKVNILGAGVATLGFDPQQGITSRFSVVVFIHVPSNLLPAEYTLEIALYSGGELVQLPSPFGGASEALRIGQVVQQEKANNPAMSVAQREHTGARHLSVIDLGNGLPLIPGGIYEWVVRIDGDEDSKVTYPFSVAGPPPAPVIG